MNANDVSEMWREACAVALTTLPQLGPARLATLLADAPPEVIWQRLAGDQRESPTARKMPASVRRSWRAVARTKDPLRELERCHRQDIAVWSWFGTYPRRLAGGLDAPAVLFAQGRADALDQPLVAIIGTRHCSNEGRAIARTFGAELSEAGVGVVSGLALGIDGGAHRGALDVAGGVPPVAVVGSGLDRVYPQRHKQLWDQLRTEGLLLSEAPLGAAPEPWRFPARNRIIAGLADLVVVIESHASGGSLITADEAIARDVPIMAVPGSIRSPASSGTNALLADGVAPACSVDDILLALRLDSSSTRRAETRRPPTDADAVVLDAIDWQPTATDDVLDRTRLPLGVVAAALHRLEVAGWIEGEAGWWQRSAEPGGGVDPAGSGGE